MCMHDYVSHDSHEHLVTGGMGCFDNKVQGDKTSTVGFMGLQTDRSTLRDFRRKVDMTSSKNDAKKLVLGRVLLIARD